jgi:hypothetical protein
MLGVGDKVRCINATPSMVMKVCKVSLVEGQIYTITKIIPLRVEFRVGVGIMSDCFDFGFRPERFAPIRRTDISVFTDMLTDIKVPETV